jgi:hypothetical protein
MDSVGGNGLLGGRRVELPTCGSLCSATVVYESMGKICPVLNCLIHSPGEQSPRKQLEKKLFLPAAVCWEGSRGFRRT